MRLGEKIDDILMGDNDVCELIHGGCTGDTTKFAHQVCLLSAEESVKMDLVPVDVSKSL